MRTIQLGVSGPIVPTVAVGCMRINALEPKDAERFVAAALEEGANFFDHADIYGGGVCESIFADAIHMTPAVREKIFLQSKCGIRPGVAFDFSKEHIVSSVEESLRRLKTDYLDVLLLHRPDPLMEPEEVAAAFDTLYESGKVRHFGVSNQNPMQIQLLQKYVKQPLIVNQLQLSLAHSYMITEDMHVNMGDDDAVNRTGGILNFCRLNDITIQAWSPFQYGFFDGVFLNNEKFPELNAKIREIAEKYNVSDTTVVMAWLLRHPAHFQPITGTMKIERLKDCLKAAELRLTREEWYELYLSAGHILP